jgi:hypothetical protein
MGKVRYYGQARVEFAPDGRSLLKIMNTDVRCIELAGGAERFRLPADTAYNSMLCWSGDGRRLARTLQDGSVVVYDSYTGKDVLKKNGQQGTVMSLALNRNGTRLAVGGANTTILVWDVPAGEAPAKVAEKEALDLWRDLESGDGNRGFKAMTRLIGSPDAAIQLFKGRLQAPKPVDAKLIAKLVADLGSDEFEERDAAEESLAAIGQPAEVELKKALKSESLEQRKRAQKLLKKLKPESILPERLRLLRVVEILDRAGTPAAGDALKGLLKLNLDSSLEEDVKRTIDRIAPMKEKK